MPGRRWACRLLLLLLSGVLVANPLPAAGTAPDAGPPLPAAGREVPVVSTAGVSPTAAIPRSSLVPPPPLAAVPTCRARLNDDPTDYAHVQDAVDASTHPTDVVKVAGYCADLEGRPPPPGYGAWAPAVITQVVYITRSLTLQGGYTLTNWTTPDPVAYPTMLDAQGQGRGLLIAGDISVTVGGLRITGGDTIGLGGGMSWNEGGEGGGLYVLSATVTISGNMVFGNGAGAGGGLVLRRVAEAVLSGNVISGNTAYTESRYYLSTGFGGGLLLYESRAVVERNTISGNQANQGGGLHASDSVVTLTANMITTNTVSYGGEGSLLGLGGGFYLAGGTVVVERNTISANAAIGYGGGPGGGAVWVDGGVSAVVRDNLITGNTATFCCGGIYVGGGGTLGGNTIVGNQGGELGGGLVVEGTDTNVVSGNVVLSNTARYGGGVSLWGGGDVLVNNIVAANRAEIGGGGIYIRGHAALRHTTVADNTAGDGSGILVAGDPYFSGTAVLTDTILAGHTVGISVCAGCAAVLEATLWNNETDWAGPGTIVTGTVNVWGDPAFRDPAGWDYHLLPGSAAVDAGIDAGVHVDVDGQPRPSGLAPDLGADELPFPLDVRKSASAALVPPGAWFTYTIRLTNTAPVTRNVTISDVLPAGLTPTGLLTWTALLPPHGAWTQDIAVATALTLAGTLTNTVAARTADGGEGTASCVVRVQPRIYLPLVIKDPEGG